MIVKTYTGRGRRAAIAAASSEGWLFRLYMAWFSRDGFKL